MKKFFTILFVTLGVIFLIVVLVASYLYFSSSSTAKPKMFGTDSKISETFNSLVETKSDETAPVEDKNPALSESQEKTLETFGVDPAALPTEISPEQEACFESVLGKERVAEIKAGDTPNVMEYLKAKDCI